MTQLIADSLSRLLGADALPRKSLDVIAAYGRLLFARSKPVKILLINFQK